MQTSFIQKTVSENDFGPNQMVFNPELFIKEEDFRGNVKKESQIKIRTRHPFTKLEDKLLLDLVKKYDVERMDNWYVIAYHMNGRTARQCRERYQLFLSDGIRRKEKWTRQEDEILLSKYETLGPRWKQMEEFFNGRTSYSIKNRYISLQRKKKKLEQFNLNTSSTFDANEKLNLNGEKKDDYLFYLNSIFDDFQIQPDFNEFGQFEDNDHVLL